MPMRGYPMGWVRILGDLWNSMDVFADLTGKSYVTLGSIHYHEARNIMGRLVFTEQDKAWYRAENNGGL